MPESYLLELFRRQELICQLEFDQPLTIGRQVEPIEPLCQVSSRPELPHELRLAIEPMSEVHVSRYHVHVCPLPAGKVRILSPGGHPLFPEQGEPVGKGETRELATPFRFTFGPHRAYGISITRRDEDAAKELQTLAHRAPSPGTESGERMARNLAALQLHESRAEGLGEWLHALVDVLQSATSSADFYQRAAEALVRLVGLHSGRVLLHEHGVWTVKVVSVAPHISEARLWPPSFSLLDRMTRDRSTVWQDASQFSLNRESQIGMQAIVAAPIRNRAGEVIGALYGDRRGELQAPVGPYISKLEAQLVETLAYGVAVGLERLLQERAATEQRVRFEQFFSSQLAEQLTSDPDLLAGRDAEVSVLFCDVRGFTRIAQHLGTHRTVTWLGELMGALTESVLRHEGVVVDYIGDALMAMWGAPVAQPDQAFRACRAALEMLAALPALNQNWKEELPAPVDVSIGINTGVAQVGNVGSKYKFKYGPLGHVVNVASRVQGVNKFLKTRLLITGETHQSLPPSFVTRRLCAVRVVNVDNPVDLYEVFASDDESSRSLCQRYEQALQEFESQQFHRAARTLGQYLPNYETDGPTHVLLSRTVDCILNPPADFDRSWEAPGK